MMKYADRKVLRYLLHQKRNSTGIFISFWLHIPKCAKRPQQIAHLAVWQNRNGLTATFIPIDYFPAPGSTPPRSADKILPHAMIEFVRRKLHGLGIKTLTGAISEREVDYGRPLTEI